MGLTLYGKLTEPQSERLESIEADVDRILAKRVGRLAIWECPDGTHVKLILAADNSVLLEIPVGEFDGMSDKALVKRVESHLSSHTPAAFVPPPPPTSPTVKYSGVYVYVEGSDLDAIAKDLASELRAFVGRRTKRMRVINQRSKRTPDLGPEDLPDWRLGLNFDKTKTLAADLKEAVEALAPLAKKYRREFVIGYFDARSKISEDLEFFKSATTAKKALAGVYEFLDIED